MCELKQTAHARADGVVDPISRLTPEDLANPREPARAFLPRGKVFYRLRSGDFRFYFE